MVSQKSPAFSSSFLFDSRRVINIHKTPPGVKVNLVNFMKKLTHTQIQSKINSCDLGYNTDNGDLVREVYVPINVFSDCLEYLKSTEFDDSRELLSSLSDYEFTARFVALTYNSNNSSWDNDIQNIVIFDGAEEIGTYNLTEMQEQQESMDKVGKKEYNKIQSMLGSMQVEFAHVELEEDKQRLYVAVHIDGTNSYMSQVVDIDANIEIRGNEELMDEIMESQYEQWEEAYGHEISIVEMIVMNPDFTCVWKHPEYQA